MPFPPTVDDRSPLWWLFIGLILAIIGAEHLSKTFLLGASGLGALLFMYLYFTLHSQDPLEPNNQPFLPKSHRIPYVRALICLLGLTFYAQYRRPPTLDLEHWRPGWHTMDIRLQRIYSRTRGLKHQLYGQGIIIDSPSLPKVFQSQRLYFMLKQRYTRSYYSGQVLRVRGHLQHIHGNYKPHSFECYLQHVHIPWQIDYGEVRSILKEGPAFFRFCQATQCQMQSLLSDTCGDASLLRCMLLNDRGSIQASQKKLFTRTGVAHLLAISGLHIGMIGLVLEFSLRLLRLSKRQRRIPCIVTLGLYTWIIGAPPSAVRAFLMLTYLWSACFFSRKATALPAISFAGILSLLTHPHQLWDWGFQFSYVAVLCIILIGSPLASCLSRRFRHPPNFSEKTSHFFWKYILRRLLAYLLQSGCISIPISLLTIPLSLEYFGSFSLSGIIINLIAIPLAFGIIVGGFGTIAIGLFLGNSNAQWILKHWLQPYTHFFENILHRCDLHLPYFWENRNLAAGTGIAIFFVISTLSLVFHHLRLKNFLRMQPNPT